MKFDHVIYEVEDRVATITLNNPEKLNAWSPRMDVDIRAAVKAAADDPLVGAIVLTGAGRGFCAGADMNVLQENQQVASAGAFRLDVDLSSLSYLTRTPKPVIAALNGSAAGIGAAMAIFCDYRFIAEDAKFTTTFGQRGLIAEFGIAWMLPRQIGMMNAMDLLTGRVLSGQEVGQMGLARAVPREAVLPRAIDFAREITKKTSPRSFAVIKKQFYASFTQSMDEAIELANIETVESLACEDHKEGIASFLEKRPPVFTGR